MSTDLGPDDAESTGSGAPDAEAPPDPADPGQPDGRVTVRLPAGSEVSTTTNGIADVSELLAGLGAAVTTTGVVAKARIEARAEVRKAEIEAETRRLEITEETRREQLRLQAGEPSPDPAEGD